MLYKSNLIDHLKVQEQVNGRNSVVEVSFSLTKIKIQSNVNATAILKPYCHHPRGEQSHLPAQCHAGRKCSALLLFS